jgi:hypothetical protein
VLAVTGHGIFGETTDDDVRPESVDDALYIINEFGIVPLTEGLLGILREAEVDRPCEVLLRTVKGTGS